MLKKRDLVTSVILTFITCGIYEIIWLIGLTDDISKLNNNPSYSGIKVFLFSLLTCGIYMIYWSYNMGKEIYKSNQQRKIDSLDNSVLYFILSLIGLRLVNFCLIQDEVNKIIDLGVE